MKHLLLTAFMLALAFTDSHAQKLPMAAEGTPYYLPCTKLCFTVKVEKTSYTPGDFVGYAEKYMKLNNLKAEPQVSYRIIDIKMHTVGDRDTSKLYVAPTDQKHSITVVGVDENNCLASINAKPSQQAAPTLFKPAPKPAPLNPRDFLNEDILAAGSSAKMAELTALEIYDIRESRSALSKGQADFMPKDGEQLRLMLANLDKQETALMQLFSGTTVKDTTETMIEYTPKTAVSGHTLFRFSTWGGLVDGDDLSGKPYSLSVSDLGMKASVQEIYVNQKEVKDNSGIYVNLPGKIKVELTQGRSQLISTELYAGQFGTTVMLNDMLFGKKFNTTLTLNPTTGGITQINAEPTKK